MKNKTNFCRTKTKNNKKKYSMICKTKSGAITINIKIGKIVRAQIKQKQKRKRNNTPIDKSNAQTNTYMHAHTRTKVER